MLPKQKKAKKERKELPVTVHFLKDSGETSMFVSLLASEADS